MIGRTLGHYQVLAELGAGGMGTVYRAVDLTLQRPAALKILEARYSTDDEAHARLLREARLASSLNHPNICTVYEVSEASDASLAFIAMELVEGRTLGSIIPKDGLPQEQTLHYGLQIADALTHAHDRGVIHRDLKAANVIVQPDGRIKVLDFGLARRLETADLDAATMTREEPLTRAGVIAGTLSYMSPEAMRGGQADARSDIWSFGVLVYEMASGRRPFDGGSVSDLTAAILRDPVPALPSGASPQVEAIVRRCLAKEPGQRYQRAGEVRAALDAIRPSITVQVTANGTGRRRWLLKVGATSPPSRPLGPESCCGAVGLQPVPRRARRCRRPTTSSRERTTSWKRRQTRHERVKSWRGRSSSTPPSRLPGCCTGSRTCWKSTWGGPTTPRSSTGPKRS